MHTGLCICMVIARPSFANLEVIALALLKARSLEARRRSAKGAVLDRGRTALGTL